MDEQCTGCIPTRLTHTMSGVHLTLLLLSIGRVEPATPHRFSASKHSWAFTAVPLARAGSFIQAIEFDDTVLKIFISLYKRLVAIQLVYINNKCEMHRKSKLQNKQKNYVPGAFLAAAVWGGQPDGQICIGGQEFRMT